MKLPAEPESRRTETEITVLETVKLSAGGEWVHSLDRGLDGTHQGPWWTKGTRQYYVPTCTAVQAQVLCKPSLPL